MLASLVLLERRPVLVKGYVESRIIRELRFLTPHRDVYELGRNVPRSTNEATQFISNLLEAEGLSIAESAPRRCLILAPNIDVLIADVLLRFSKAWVASCIATPQQGVIQKSNAAIYDVNEKKWLNVDLSKTRTSWIRRTLHQAMSKNNDELTRAYLDLIITQVSKKASTLYRYLSAAIGETSEIWRDLGEPEDEERDTIIALCKSEYDIDSHTALIDTSGNKNEKPLKNRTYSRTTAIEKVNAVEILAQKISDEERRLRRCLEDVKSRIG